MNTHNRWITLVAALTASVWLPACTHPADIDQDKRGVQQVLEKYLQSVKTADLKLGSEVWLQGPDILVVTPFGRFQGWDGVRDGLYVNFLQKAFTERSLQPSHLAIDVAGDAAPVINARPKTSRPLGSDAALNAPSPSKTAAAAGGNKTASHSRRGVGTPRS